MKFWGALLQESLHSLCIILGFCCLKLKLKFQGKLVVQVMIQAGMQCFFCQTQPRVGMLASVLLNALTSEDQELSSTAL